MTLNNSTDSQGQLENNSRLDNRNRDVVRREIEVIDDDKITYLKFRAAVGSHEMLN